MRSKIICHIITSLSSGGAEGTLAKLAINDSYHKHIVISLSGRGKYEPILRDKGIQVINFDFEKSLSFVFSFTKLVLTINKIKPDIVQTWLYHADLIGGLAAKACNVRSIIWNIRTSFIPQNYKISTVIVRKICALLSWTIPEKIITCAKSSIPIHEKLGYCVSKFHIIYNGFHTPKNINLEKKSSFLNSLDLNPEFFNIINIGRYAPQKDHQNFLNSIKIFREKYNELDSLGLNIIFIGKNTNKIFKDNKWFKSNDYNCNICTIENTDEIYKYILHMDLSILSSAYGEAFPNVIAESMICGVPCIATDVGDSKYIIGGKGWVIEPSNSLKLAKAIFNSINFLIKDEKRKKKISNECRAEIIKKFSLEEMCKNYSYFYASK